LEPVQVSSFSDGEEMPSTPTTDLLFVPRESPHCLFIQQPDQSLASTTMANDTPDLTEIATPTHRNSGYFEFRADLSLWCVFCIDLFSLASLFAFER
jgi:hypothetical protein